MILIKEKFYRTQCRVIGFIIDLINQFQEKLVYSISVCSPDNNLQHNITDCQLLQDFSHIFLCPSFISKPFSSLNCVYLRARTAESVIGRKSVTLFSQYRIPVAMFVMSEGALLLEAFIHPLIDFFLFHKKLDVFNIQH